MSEGEEYEVEEVSDEEKLQIAQHYLLNAPPGQFNDVLTDVRALLPAGLLSEPMLAGIAREFNTKNMRQLKSGDQSFVLSKAAEVDATHYQDPKSGRVLAVNHVAGSVIEDDTQPMAAAMEPTVEEHRAEIELAMTEYVESQYYDDTACASVLAKGNEVTVILSAEKLNLRNFWSGQWISTWTATLEPTGTTVAGELKTRAHYFEDGNVQLQTKKPITAATLPQTDPAGVAQALRDHISLEEKTLQEGLEEMYLNMTDETFKAMRRVMPVHRNKVSWNINEVKLNSNLTAK